MEGSRLRWAPFGLATCALSAFVLLGPHEALRAGPLGWVDEAMATAVARACRDLGWPVRAAGPLVIHRDGFGMEIYYRCTGLLPVTFLVAAILTLPARVPKKIAGAVLGGAVVLAVNFGRLIALLALGVSAPRAFVFAHSVVGEALIGAAVLGCWLAWIRWAVPSRGEPRP